MAPFCFSGHAGRKQTLVAFWLRNRYTQQGITGVSMRQKSGTAMTAAEKARAHRERVAERERATADLLVLLLAEAPDLIQLGVRANPVYQRAIAAAERIRGAA